MRMRAFLALFVRPERSLVLHQRSVLAKFAVGKYRESRDAAAAIVGGEKIFSRAIEGKITGIFAQRGKLVEQGQLAGLRIDGESADGARFPRLVRGI